MNLPVILSPAARRELDEAADWYESEAGSGAEFVAKVQDSLDLIGQQLELHRLIYKQIRRAPVSGFLYYIFYRIYPDRVEIIAITHGHRDPSRWKGRA